jgi:hypothetical protein
METYEHQVCWSFADGASCITGGTTLTELPGRLFLLTFAYEIEGVEHTITIKFDDVQSYKCSFKYSCTVKQICSAYEQLIELEQSEWLQMAQSRLNEQELHHYMIFFDGDEVCYEFICGGFSLEEAPTK